LKKIKIIAVSATFLFIASILSAQGGLIITSNTQDLKQGDKGDAVTEVQIRLNNWGYYNYPINGDYDQNTSSAVKAFQKDQKLNVSGIADKNTLTAMGMTKLVNTDLVQAEGNADGDVQLLARAINGEARGEPYEGQVAVGAVIINRTKDPRFPKTIAGVIYQPGAFTAVSDGQINIALDPSSTVVNAARDALNGWDPTSGSVYYWNPATATSTWIWSRQIVAKIGKHYFGK